MKTQQIISELKDLLNKPEVVNGFKTQADCLSWSNKVASLLQATKEHHAFFMERLNILNVSGLSADTYASTFRIMVSIANQALFELEHNMPSVIADASIPEKKQFIDTFWGRIAVVVVGGLILFFITRHIIKTPPMQQPLQSQPTPTTGEGQKKIPSSPPVPKK